MFKALFKKKFREFQASQGLLHLGFWLLLSLAPLFCLWFDGPRVISLVIFLMLILVWFMGGGCAIRGFHGDFTNQSNRFLEYLPVTRSAVWLVNYLSGLAFLFLMMALLLWLGILLYPWFIDLLVNTNEIVRAPPLARLIYFLPNRTTIVISFASYLFLSYSMAIFFAAYSKGKEGQAVYPIGGTMLPVSLFIPPFILILTLKILAVLPSGLALSPVLLMSGLLFSISSYALYAWVPKIIKYSKLQFLGLGLFLVLIAALVGHLYIKSLTWRALDPTLPLNIERVFKPHLEEAPNLLLAEVDSCRSGKHYVSIDVKNAAFHDLGRGLRFIDMPGNKSGLLFFGYSPNLERASELR